MKLNEADLETFRLAFKVFEKSCFKELDCDGVTEIYSHLYKLRMLEQKIDQGLKAPSLPKETMKEDEAPLRKIRKDPGRKKRIAEAKKKVVKK